jgi:hypothetical protein
MEQTDRLLLNRVLKGDFMKKNMLLVLIIFLTFRAVMYSQENEHFEIHIQKNTIVITGYRGKAKDIKIPGAIDSLRRVHTPAACLPCEAGSWVVDSIPVTTIGDIAFSSKGLTNVVIPEGISSIRRVTVLTTFPFFVPLCP